MKIGDPMPAGTDDLEFVTIDSKTPHENEFDAADAGKRVHYMLRWVSTRGEPARGAPRSRP